MFESVNDHVTASIYPFDAKDLCERWKSFCLKLSVSFTLFFSGSINFILSNPLILINSSIKSTSWKISVLQEGTSTFKIFLFFLHLNPKDDKILSA